MVVSTFFIYALTMAWLCDCAHLVTNVALSSLFNCSNTTYEDDEIHGRLQYLTIM